MSSTNLPPCCVPSPKFDPVEFAYTRFCLATNPPGTNLHGGKFPTWAEIKEADDPYEQEFVKQFSFAVTSLVKALQEGFLDDPDTFRASVFESLTRPQPTDPIESFTA